MKKRLVTLGLIALLLGGCGSESDKYLETANSYFAEGKYDYAGYNYIRVLELDRSNEEAYFGVIDSFIAQERYDDALDYLENAEMMFGTSVLADRREILEEKLEKKDTNKATEVISSPTTNPTPEVTEPPVELTSIPEPTYSLELEYTFSDIDAPMYVTADVNVRDLPSVDGNKVGILKKDLKIDVLRQCNETGWYEFIYNGELRYVSSKYLSMETSTYEPTSMSVPTATPKPTAMPKPTATPKPTAMPKPTATLKPTSTPVPTVTPKPTSTPVPTVTPKPTSTPVPTVTPKPTSIPAQKSTTPEDYFAYSINDGCVTIDYLKSNGEKLTEINIPSEIEGYPVTCIGSGAFSQWSNIKKVTIPDTVTEIRELAFEMCYNLNYVDIPDSVTYIGKGAFQHCSSLDNIKIPEGVTFIGVCLFSKCHNLKNLELSDSIVCIEESAFYECEELSEIEIPKNLYKVGVDAFSGTAWLNNQRAKSSMVIINDVLFTVDTSLQSIVIPEGVKVIAGGACAWSKANNVELPDSLIEIGDKAFYDCENLTQIELPDRLTSVGDMAFLNCEKLAEIEFSESLNKVGESAFSGTTWFDNQMAEGPVVIINNVLIGIDTSLQSVIVPEGVEYIAEGACEKSKAISIKLPDSLIEIGDSAFYNCYNLTQIELPNGLMSIGNYAFDGCNSLSKLIIPDSTLYIGKWAFNHCYNIEITIPSSVVSIGQNALKKYPKKVIVQEGSYAHDYVIENGIPYSVE